MEDLGEGKEYDQSRLHEIFKVQIKVLVKNV